MRSYSSQNPRDAYFSSGHVRFENLNADAEPYYNCDRHRIDMTMNLRNDKSGQVTIEETGEITEGRD
jgi:hypothetical protein